MDVEHQITCAIPQETKNPAFLGSGNMLLAVSKQPKYAAR